MCSHRLGAAFAPAAGAAVGPWSAGTGGDGGYDTNICSRNGDISPRANGIYSTDVSALTRFVALLAAAAVLGGCSAAVGGHATLAAGATRAAGAGPTGRPAPSPTPTAPKRRDPAAVARAVDLRAADLGWKLIPGSTNDRDSLAWLIVCGRDAGVGPGSMSGAATPDYSATGRNSASQVGSATGLFKDDDAAHRYVGLLRDRSVGRCMAAEALRNWPDSFSGTVPPFTPASLRAAGAAEAAGLTATVARSSDGRRETIQFFAVRTGPIVTMLDTIWVGDPDTRLLESLAARLAHRQHLV